MKTIKYAIIAGLLASSALSANAGGHSKKSMSYDDFVFKARVGYMNVSDDVQNTSTTKHVFKNGFAGEIATEYFFTKNIAVETAVGYGRADLKRTATSNNKKDAVSFVPVTATLQYHLMPSESFSPYIGVGYSYEITSGGPTGTKIDNGGGAVAQLGFDMPMNDTFGLNVDVKYTHKVDHEIKFINTKYKAKTSTIKALAGVAFPF